MDPGNKSMDTSAAPEDLVMAGLDNCPPKEDKAPVLLLEYAHDTYARYYVRTLQFILFVTLGILVVTVLWVREIDGRNDHRVVTFNLALGSVSAVCLLTFGWWSMTLANETRRKKVELEKGRRRRMILSRVDFAFQLLVVVFFFTSNVYIHVDQCAWATSAAEFLAFFRWLALSVIVSNQFCHLLAISTKESLTALFKKLGVWGFIGRHSTGIQGRNGSELPAWFFILVFGIFFTPVMILSTLILLSNVGPLGNHWCSSADDAGCILSASGGYIVDCSAWNDTCATNSSKVNPYGLTTVILLIVYLALYIIFVFSLLWALQSQPYLTHRATRVEIGFQVQTRVPGIMVLALSLILLWLLEPNTCRAYFFSVAGYTPHLFCLSVLVSLSLWMHSPFLPSDAEIEEYGRRNDILLLESQVSGDRKEMFCVETAVKALYYSFLVYDIEEVEDSSWSIDFAQESCNMESHKLVWHKVSDAKCIISWNKSTKNIILAFRGTASTKNVVIDMKFWRSAHPPKRGNYFLTTCPLVHTGFLQFWHISGLKIETLKILKDVICDASKDQKWNILVCGHSLGGAAAKLASFDIQTELESKIGSLSCYTFGCPRVGNHAFRRSYRKKVKISWDLMHFDDVVCHSGKFIFLYKRAGSPLILTKSGPIVTPSKMELLTMRGIKLSLQMHMLTSYLRSILHILDNHRVSSPTEIRALFHLRGLPIIRESRSLLSSSELMNEKNLDRLASIQSLGDMAQADIDLAAGNMRTADQRN